MCTCAEPFDEASHTIDDCGGLRIEDEGTLLPREKFLNFKGSGITAVDNNAAHRTDVTVIGAGTQSTFDVTGPITGNTNYDTTIADGDDIGIAIIIGRDGGAIVKQGSSPGTEQASSNFNISGTGTAKHALVAGDGPATSDDLLSVRNDDAARNNGLSFAAIQGIGNGAQQDPVAQLRFGNDDGTPQGAVGLYSSFGGTEPWENAATLRLSTTSSLLFVTNSINSGQVDTDGSLFTLAHPSVDTNFHRFCHFDSGGAGQIGITTTGDETAPDLSLWHGSMDYINDAGTERQLFSSTNTDGQIVFGNVAYHRLNPRLGQFQFVFDDPGNQVFNIGSPKSDTGVTNLSLRAPDSAGNGDGVKLIAYAVPGQTEDFSVVVGGFEKMRIYGDNFADSTKIAVEAINPCVTDNATASIFFSATDSGANTSNVSAGIELPNSVGVAGDYVVRTGGTGASGSGTPLFRVIGAQVSYAPATVFPQGMSLIDAGGPGSPMLVISEMGYPLGASDPAAPLVITLGSADAFGSRMAANFVNLDDSGNIDFVQLGFSSSDSGGPAYGTFEFQNSGNGDGGAWFGMNFDPSHGNADPFRVWGNGAAGEVAVDVNPDGAIFPPAPQAAVYARHATLPSALFQTSATDGSNANPTLVVAGNTGQNAPLTEWRGTDGTTVVGAFSPKGLLSLTPDADGATAITLTTTDSGGGVDLFSWDLTTGAEHALGTIGSTAYDSNFHSFNVPTGWNHFSAGPLGAPIFAVSDGGNVDAASYSVGAVPGDSGTFTTVDLKTVTVVNGIVTQIS